MGVPTITGLGPDPTFEDVTLKINSLVNELRNTLLTLDTVNVLELNAEVITAGSITADKIGANQITAGKIASKAVTADKIDVNELSAISANMGTITAGTLNAINIFGSFISGTTIVGGSVNIGDGRFTVDNNGNATAASVDITGGNITGPLNVDIGNNITINNRVVLSNTNFGNGIRWGTSPGIEIFIDPASKAMYLTSPAGIYANGVRIDVP